MSEIIPRWEWRTFGGSLAEAAGAILEHEVTRVKESVEQYIVSKKGHDNVKIREGLIDIKTLLNTNADGLEQWTVLLKEGFPVNAEKLAAIYDSFRVERPQKERHELAFDEFMNEWVRDEDDLPVVRVEKKRNGYMIDGCIVEIAQVGFNGRPFETIGIEHEDPALVMATVRKLGLTRYENVNYIRAMKRSEGIDE